MTAHDPLATLRRRLDESGATIDDDEIGSLLEDCWHLFDGNRGGRMTSSKLPGRLECVEWDPPLLSFIIERHGAAVLGSNQAELQSWELDLDNLTARHGTTGRRRLRPNAPPLDVEPFVEEAFRLIVDGRQDPRLTWRPDGLVAVRIGKIIPANGSPQQTVEGRRRRFRTALDQRIERAGGHTIRANLYRPPPRSGSLKTTDVSTLTRSEKGGPQA